jgi:Methylase involved in ubiquinone/menaquinone biosynthesis
MRRFSEEYLTATRTGMWADRDALADLALPTRERVLDVGAGTGELTRVLREEAGGDQSSNGGGQVVAVDADPALVGAVPPPRLLGDATRLPVADDAVDLVVCQALLVNLDDPATALAEFVRVSTDRVAAIEPDNSAVTVESTVDSEEPLAQRARRMYLRGSAVDPALGSSRGLFERAGLSGVSVRRYDHVRTVEPPYSGQALESARRKASGAGLATDRETMLAAGVTAEAFDRLRGEWRAMGRQVVEQMRAGEYRRRETVRFLSLSDSSEPATCRAHRPRG